MGRARHRLTALRQAVINTPEIKTGREYTVEALMDQDTYIHHVGGLNVGGGRDYNVNLGGATGHTGSTSDSYFMASGIQKTGTGPSFTVWQPPYEREFLEIGAWLPNDFVTLDTGNTPRWKYEFNSRDYSINNNTGQTYDGSLGGRAQRAYFIINLNLDSNSYQNGEVKVAAGDEIVSAELCLKLNAIMFHDRQSFDDTKFPNFSSVYNVDSDRIIDGASFDSGGTYCAYKVVRGFTATGGLGDLNWLGWSGGIGTNNADSDYWVQAGGSKYSADGSTGDITDLGVSSCYTFLDQDYSGFIPRQSGLPPIFSDFQSTVGGRGPIVLGVDDPLQTPGDLEEDDQGGGITPPGGGSGGDPTVGDNTEICFDVTHIVQDAIDNESNLVRIAIYRDDDGGAEAIPDPLNSYQPTDTNYTPPGGIAGGTADLLDAYDQSMDPTNTPTNNTRALFHEQFRHAIRVHSSNSPDSNLRPKLTYTFIDKT